MESSDFPVSKSPRRELQGPRPAPLKVRKDSYKIKKPPVAPPPQQQQHHHHQQQPAAPPRLPVIIYTVSPKVIHTNPNDFMTLVQRLTGSGSSSTASLTSTSASASASSYDHSTGAISPAARYASIEKTKLSPTERNKKVQMIHNEDGNSGFAEGIEMDHNIERSCLFPGILSPWPTSLSMIPPSFFSPPSDPNTFSFLRDLSPVLLGNKNFTPSFFNPPSYPDTFSFLHDLSPVLLGNKNFIEGSFMPSPSTFVSPHITTSPTPSIDLFNNFFDF